MNWSLMARRLDCWGGNRHDDTGATRRRMMDIEELEQLSDDYYNTEPIRDED